MPLCFGPALSKNPSYCIAKPNAEEAESKSDESLIRHRTVQTFDFVEFSLLIRE